ncbi:DUF1127 domain-containing protein [Jannaschia sp. 2305UL9-9]
MTYMPQAIRSAIAERRRRRDVRAELSLLSDRALEDIGMNRADVDARFG